MQINTPFDFFFFDRILYIVHHKDAGRGLPSHTPPKSHLSSLRNQSWCRARLSVNSSTLTVPWCLSASVQPPGAGVVGFKLSSVPSSNPDPLLLIASTTTLLLFVPSPLEHDYLCLCPTASSSVRPTEARSLWTGRTMRPAPPTQSPPPVPQC